MADSNTLQPKTATNILTDIHALRIEHGFVQFSMDVSIEVEHPESVVELQERTEQIRFIPYPTLANPRLWIVERPVNVMDVYQHAGLEALQDIEYLAVHVTINF